MNCKLLFRLSVPSPRSRFSFGLIFRNSQLRLGTAKHFRYSSFTSTQNAKEVKSTLTAKEEKQVASKVSETKTSLSKEEEQDISEEANAAAEIQALAAAKATSAVSWRQDPWGFIKTLPRKTMEELKHYWMGTKLLVLEVRTTFSILYSITKGHKLSRRERRQLLRTFTDLLRVIPFAVFVIVPFMELLLPVALKLFPNMLPSTFEGTLQKEENIKRKLKARIGFAKFLQEAAAELPTPDVRKKAQEEGLDFGTFMEKVRSGIPVSNEEILKFAKVFKDEFTLDNANRAQLIAMCKYMGLPSFGTDSILRFQLSQRLKQLKRDDRSILDEGIHVLSLSELQSALRARGMRASSNSKPFLRKKLSEWLDLSITHNLPSSMLVLSRAFIITENETQQDALKEAISSLPDELLEEVKLKLDDDLGRATVEQKLEVLKHQNELIAEEAKAEKEKKEKEDKLKDIKSEENETSKPKEALTEETLKGITEALSVLASDSGVEPERLEVSALKAERDRVHKEQELREKVGTIKKQVIEEVLDELNEIKKKDKSQILKVEDRGDDKPEKKKEKEARISKKLETKLDKMVQELEKEISRVEQSVAGKLKVIDKDNDGIISAKELTEAISYLKEKLNQQTVEEVIEKLDADKDGRIRYRMQNFLTISVHELLRFAADIDEQNSTKREGQEKKN